MSNFLKLVQESMPPQVLPQSNQPSLSGGKIVDTKKGGILNKVTSAAQKVSTAMDTIEKYGTGKWDINDVLQKMLSKQLDKSTDKVGAFGKGKYNQIKLGDDIITKINNYSIDADTDSGATLKRARQSLSGMQNTLDELPQKGDPFTNESTLNLRFLYMINEAAAALGKDNKSGKSKKEQVWDVLKSALDLPEDAPSKLTHPDPRMKEEFDKRIRWIAAGGKDVVAFLNRIKGEYPDIPFTFGALDKEEEPQLEDEPVEDEPVEDEPQPGEEVSSAVKSIVGDDEMLNMLVKKYNITNISDEQQRAIDKLNEISDGMDSEMKRHLLMTALITQKNTWSALQDSARRYADRLRQDIANPSGSQGPVEDEEFNFEKTNIGDWIKTLGAERAEKIVKGLVDIYPAQRIVFDEPVEDEPVEDEPVEDEPVEDEPVEDDPVEDEPVEDEPAVTQPVEDEPEVTLTDENALFELAGRTSFGAQGIQWTLKPKLADVDNILKESGIKYLTFLLQTNDNAFRAPESNAGIVYAYDDNNELINPITTENTRFQWNGQEGLYTLSTDNKELMGIKYSEGQFPINKDEVLPLTDGVHILYRPDENSAYMKFKIVQDMNDAKMYLIDKDKGLAATPEDIAEAEAVGNK